MVSHDDSYAVILVLNAKQNAGSGFVCGQWMSVVCHILHCMCTPCRPTMYNNTIALYRLVWLHNSVSASPLLSHTHTQCQWSQCSLGLSLG